MNSYLVRDYDYIDIKVGTHIIGVAIEQVQRNGGEWEWLPSALQVNIQERKEAEHVSSQRARMRMMALEELDRRKAASNGTEGGRDAQSPVEMG